MKKSLLLTILCLPFMAQANDSTGTVSTGGVEYIKNEHIAMQKENLFISQDKIKVEYEYRNLTDKDCSRSRILGNVAAKSGNSEKSVISHFKRILTANFEKRKRPLN